MIARWLLGFGGVGLAMSMGSSLAYTQAAAPNGSQSGGSQSGFTLQANTRVVLTDVTVTDRNGNPVSGLKSADFHIFDNKKPQEIASFEEHRKGDAPPWHEMPVAAGVYSNDYVAHPPGVLNVVLLDLTNISIPDQMWLNYQLGKFIDALKPDDPIAIYARTGGACILLQSFTADHALLRAAVKRILPRFPPPGREYLSNYQTLEQIEAYLSQIPGRKNVLWFSGGSTLFLRPDVTDIENYQRLQAVYDGLEANRIAVYPIDARGLTLYGGPMILAQHGVMSDVATATGGKALYDNNGLAIFAAKTVDSDGDYYTLTYSPHDLKYDNKWHKVRVELVGGGYTLSYRRGYFADANVQPQQKESTQPRTRLLASGAKKDELPTNGEPIVFQASVLAGAISAADLGTGAAASEKKAPRGTSPFTVRYLLPLKDFQIDNVNGEWNVECGAAVLAFNENGTLLTKKAQQVTFEISDGAARQPAGDQLQVKEAIDLGKGDVYLFLAVWDTRTHRLGTLEIPYQVSPPSKQASLQPSK